MVTDKAEKNVDEVLAEQPIKPIALVGKNELGFSKAKDIFEKALQDQIKGDYQSAIDLYTSACTVCPELYEPYYNMALCYEKLHQINDAIKHFEKAAALNRFYQPIFLHLGKLYSKKDDEVRSATNWAIYHQM